ncbi:hypothetical protein C882_1725 [Caenispirillum salinarum AK4]|uniref:DUF4878 domain-containing protein n=1 Tax=Caenispirillum salinarum AK4 TaxID=1238182 RepID=K9H5M7_9PROT|nr:hypothetical protein [Caenispirillum salinarum]EKV32887.1 hypothetical protein C882_1725 [Caenispirillum salinarum AK4]
MKKLFAATVCAMTLVLAACGGPSDSDVQDAVRAAVEAEFNENMELGQDLGQLMSGGRNTPLQARMAAEQEKARKMLDGMEVDVGNVTENSDGTYTAVVTLTFPGGDTNTDTVTLMEGAEGWVVKE